MTGYFAVFCLLSIILSSIYSFNQYPNFNAISRCCSLACLNAIELIITISSNVNKFSRKGVFPSNCGSVTWIAFINNSYTSSDAPFFFLNNSAFAKYKYCLSRCDVFFVRPSTFWICFSNSSKFPSAIFLTISWTHS